MSRPGVELSKTATPPRRVPLWNYYVAVGVSILIIAIIAFIAGFLFGNDLSDLIGRRLGYVDTGEGSSPSGSADLIDDVVAGIFSINAAMYFSLPLAAIFLLIVTVWRLVPDRLRRTGAVVFFAGTLVLFAALVLF